MSAKPLVVGRVVKPHGVHGELVVEVRTDSPELRFAPGAELGVRRRGDVPDTTLTVVAARPHTGRLLVRAEGIEGRETAEELRGALLTISPEQLEALDDPDEFHDSDLEGLRVVLRTGAEVGAVREVLHTPAGELLAVSASQGREALIPFVSDIVPEVHLAAGYLVIDPPEGLVDAE